MTFIALSQKKEQLSFLFVGDVMQHGPQIKGAYNAQTDSYDYMKSFQFVRPIIEGHDLAIANLEVTHAGKPYKGYPQFSAPDELSYALRESGFDIILTSNNHSCDGGAKGVIRTLDVLDNLGLKHTGTFRNKKERDANYPLIVNQNGMKVAILNYTYGTNGLVVPAPLIINYIDSAVIKEDVMKAKRMADYIICTMHWGTEYQPLPSKYQKNWEKYVYELGVDMVIGGHPHVVQPIERKEVNNSEKFTVWSLGNFVSNQRSRYKNGGLMVSTTLDKMNKEVTLGEAGFFLTYVHVREEQNSRPYYILPDFDFYTQDSTFMNSDDAKLMSEFMTDSRSLMKEHGIDVSELRLKSSWNDRIELMINGYFSTLLSIESNSIWPSNYSKKQKQFIHRTLGPDGKYYYLSGYMNNLSETGVNRLFLQKYGLTQIGKVVVKPDQIKVIR